MAAQAGYNGMRELAAREVPDPYDGTKLTVIVNNRESSLAHLLARGLIDDGQKLAGDRFRQIYERSIVGGARAIDYEWPKVDGGRFHDPMNDSLHEAAKHLRLVRSIVGEYDYRLLVEIAGQGRTIREITPSWQGVTSASLNKKAELYVGHRFRDALALLAIRWGFAQPIDAR